MRILLADDHKILRDGLRAILSKEHDMLVVGEAEDGCEAIALSRSRCPDVIVMDVSMPGLNGVEATRRVLEASPAMKVVGLSMHADPRYVHALFDAGAAGYLLKNAAAEELVLALRAVVGGRSYVSPGAADVVVAALRGDARPDPGDPSHLTTREREALQLLAEGLTSKEIAARMSIAVSTVETYRRQIMAKLDVHSIAALTRYAIRHGLTSAE